NDLEAGEYISGIGPQAGSFSTINRVPPAAVKASGKYRISRLLSGERPGCHHEGTALPLPRKRER
ncbi:hypothetical protein NS44R_14810, partial [Mammaliicoccus sciuri]